MCSVFVMIVFVFLLYFFHSVCVCDDLQVLVVTDCRGGRQLAICDVVVSCVRVVFVFVFVSMSTLSLCSHHVVEQSLVD